MAVDPRVVQLLKPVCGPDDLKVTLDEMEKRLVDTRYPGFDMPRRHKLLESLMADRHLIQAFILRKTVSRGLAQDFADALPTGSTKKITQEMSAPHFAKLCHIALLVKACEAKSTLKVDIPAWKDLVTFALLVQQDARDEKFKNLAAVFYNPSQKERKKDQWNLFKPEYAEFYPDYAVCYACQHRNVRQGIKNIKNHNENIIKLQVHDITVNDFEKDRDAARVKHGISRVPPKPALLPVTINCYCYQFKCTDRVNEVNCRECIQNPGSHLVEKGECQCTVCLCPCREMVHLDKVSYIKGILSEQMY